MTKEETAAYILGLKDAIAECETEIDCIRFADSIGHPFIRLFIQVATNIKQLIQDKIDMMGNK